jgi:CIC family chloride channel protein
MRIFGKRQSVSLAGRLASVRNVLPGMDEMALAADWAESRDTVVLVLLSALVGVLCGFAAFAFTWLIETITTNSFPFTWLPGFSPLDRALVIILAPAVGGLIVGPLIGHFASEARGHGVPAVMRALVERGGVIHPKIALVKTIASAITLGTGGSAGREGPIVQVGASLGSAVGQVTRVRESQLRTLVVCGAAGGIAAIFNAPFAGVFYGTEVLLAEFEARSISAIVLAAVAASIVIRALRGNNPAFAVPNYSLVSPVELGPYLVLGALAGLLSVVFILVLYTAEDGFHALRIPAWVKPALGGLVVGVLGLAYPLTITPYPPIFGSTYVPIGAAVANRIGLGLLVALLGGKLIATALTLGSGGSGGVFGPSLFLGATLGGAFGIVANALLPGLTAPPGAYALVGMAAVLGAAGHAPITGIMLAFEMVDNYQMILPLMVTTVVAFLITRFLARESIDTLALARIGIVYRARPAAPVAAPPGPLQSTTVGDVMTTDLATVSPNLPLAELTRYFNETGHHGFPVVDDQGKLVGIVTLKDLENTILAEPDAPAPNGASPSQPREVADIMSTDLAFAYPDESLEEALRLMALRNVGRLPVVEPGSPTKLVGILRRSDLIEAFRRQGAPTPLASKLLDIGAWGGTRFIEIVLAPGAPAANQPIRDLAPSLPPDTLIIAVRRARTGQVLLPRGDTIAHPGDVVALLTRPQYDRAARRLFEKTI